MSRIKLPNQKKAYQSLDKRVLLYISQIQAIYDEAARKTANLVVDIDYDGTEPFSFASYADLRQKVRDIQAQVANGIQSVIYSGTGEEWKQSNVLQDLLVKKAMTYYRAQVNGKRKKQYFQTNSDVLKAFQTRAENGINLSSKIWNVSDEMMREMEATIGVAIQKGMTAITLSKRIMRYLHDYPSLKRDFVQKYARVFDIRDCEYRAIRLARSEINIAYRLAEQTRWQQLDFVLGYEIKLSGSHPATDICDVLKGRYSKLLRWNGWHPNCFCYAVPIIMNDDEYEKYIETGDIPQRAYDTDKLVEYVNTRAVDLKNQLDRGVAPYWYKDNAHYINRLIKGSSYTMTEIDAAALSSVGFALDPAQYNSSAMKGFNLFRFNTEMESVGKEHEINWTKRAVQVYEDGVVELSYKGKYAKGGRVELYRNFSKNEKEEVEVEHSLFSLPKALQGKGISKTLFKAMFKEYEAMSVSKIRLCANLDVGSYCWARYGFLAEKTEEIRKIADEALKLKDITKSEYDTAIGIIKRYGKEHGFPVIRLAALDFGKRLLVGFSKQWHGYLDMKDVNNVKYFKDYIKSK